MQAILENRLGTRGIFQSRICYSEYVKVEYHAPKKNKGIKFPWHGFAKNIMDSGTNVTF